MSEPSVKDMTAEAEGRRAQAAIGVLGDVFDAEIGKVMNAVFAKIDSGQEISSQYAVQSLMHLYSLHRTRTKLTKLADQGVRASQRTADVR